MLKTIASENDSFESLGHVHPVYPDRTDHDRKSKKKKEKKERSVEIGEKRSHRPCQTMTCSSNTRAMLMVISEDSATAAILLLLLLLLLRDNNKIDCYSSIWHRGVKVVLPGSIPPWWTPVDTY